MMVLFEGGPHDKTTLDVETPLRPVYFRYVKQQLSLSAFDREQPPKLIKIYGYRRVAHAVYEYDPTL